MTTPPTHQSAPLLSVIFPFLNASEDVEGVFGAIASQLQVDKEKMEIIVVNDGSSDDTLQKVEQYRPLMSAYQGFKVISHPRRMGLAQTRLDGALAARGKFVTFVDKKSRADKDYLFNLLNKHRNLVIGNVYIKKEHSYWGRLLILVRKKFYYPYFNHPFEDIELDHDAYKNFKNKGGGGAMLVLRTYYLEVAQQQKRGIDVNDDTMLLENLTKLEPLLKTSTANIEYLNRSGFKENVVHLYNRGPKFVDYYMNPSTRLFPLFLLVIIIFFLNVAFAIFARYLFVYELVLALMLLLLVSLYLSESLVDFGTCVLLLPVAAVSFSVGILKGFFMKLFRMY